MVCDVGAVALVEASDCVSECSCEDSSCGGNTNRGHEYVEYSWSVETVRVGRASVKAECVLAGMSWVSPDNECGNSVVLSLSAYSGVVSKCTGDVECVW